MNMITLLIRPTTALILALTLLVSAQTRADGGLQIPERRPTAPELVLTDIHGVTHRLSDLRGSVVLVNFWATWCGPCRIEMPEIQAVWEEHKDAGLVVLALDQSETAKDVQAYFEELGLTFTPLLDEDNRTSRNFGLQGTLPASVFINPDGEVSVIHRGVMTRGQLDGFLDQTLTS